MKDIQRPMTSSFKSITTGLSRQYDYKTKRDCNLLQTHTFVLHHSSSIVFNNNHVGGLQASELLTVLVRWGHTSLAFILMTLVHPGLSGY